MGFEKREESFYKVQAMNEGHGAMHEFMDRMDGSRAT